MWGMSVGRRVKRSTSNIINLWQICGKGSIAYLKIESAVLIIERKRCVIYWVRNALVVRKMLHNFYVIVSMFIQLRRSDRKTIFARKNYFTLWPLSGLCRRYTRLHMNGWSNHKKNRIRFFKFTRVRLDFSHFFIATHANSLASHTVMLDTYEIRNRMESEKYRKRLPDIAETIRKVDHKQKFSFWIDPEVNNRQLLIYFTSNIVSKRTIPSICIQYLNIKHH